MSIILWKYNLSCAHVNSSITSMLLCCYWLFAPLTVSYLSVLHWVCSSYSLFPPSPYPCYVQPFTSYHLPHSPQSSPCPTPTSIIRTSPTPSSNEHSAQLAMFDAMFYIVFHYVYFCCGLIWTSQYEKKRSRTRTVL